MGIEKLAEIKGALLEIAKAYCPSSFEDMMVKYNELRKEVGV